MEASTAINFAAEETDATTPLISTLTDDKLIKEEKRKCYKNLIIFSLSYFFAFSAFNGLGNLQSTLNKEGHIGVTALLINSVAYFFSCLLLPALTFKHFGYKRTLFFSQLTITFYICANFYPKWWTLYPTAALYGLAAGPLWTIQGCLITDLAKDYALLAKEQNDVIISRFFGIFTIISQFQQVFGNFISSFVLKKASSFPWQNLTLNKTDHGHCGAVQCVDIADQISVPLDYSSVQVMCYVYLAISIGGVTMVALFLDNIEHKAKLQSTRESMLEAVGLFKDLKAWCFVPITAMTAFFSIFIATDFTKSFIACLGGIDHIGYWFCIYGLIASLSSFIVGHSVKFVGRIAFFLAAFTLTISLHVFMLFWKPQTSQFYVLYIFTLFFGFAEGVWLTEINCKYPPPCPFRCSIHILNIAMISSIFYSRVHQAFANHRLCSSITVVIGYAYSVYLCVRYKIYVILASAGLSLVTLIALEIQVRSSPQHVKKK